MNLKLKMRILETFESQADFSDIDGHEILVHDDGTVEVDGNSVGKLRIVEFSDNERLHALSDGLVKELHLYRRRSLLQGGGMKVSNAEHKVILAALELRKPEQAGQALEDHIEAGKQRFFSASTRNE